ncbi:MAG: phage portal protein [Bacteroidales bacterium]
MGLFGKIKSVFSNKSPTEVQGVKLVTERGNGFYSWNGKLYKSDIIRSCIRPKYKAIGKLEAQHIRKGTDGIKINPEAYMRFLLEEPNQYMSGQQLLEKLTVQLELNNNAFALITRDGNGMPNGIYPIPSTSV